MNVLPFLLLCTQIILTHSIMSKINFQQKEDLAISALSAGLILHVSHDDLYDLFNQYFKIAATRIGYDLKSMTFSLMRVATRDVQVRLFLNRDFFMAAPSLRDCQWWFAEIDQIVDEMVEQTD